MTYRRKNCLIRLRPRSDQLHVSQDRSVIVTARDGFIHPLSQDGFFVHQTRLLSDYRYFIDRKPFIPVALSNVEQHSWMGYYIAPPKVSVTKTSNRGSGYLEQPSQDTLELCISRYVGLGVHEDLDLTNYTQEQVSFQLGIALDADFADYGEVTGGTRQQRGKIRRGFRQLGSGEKDKAWELEFDYRATHSFSNQQEKGTATTHRGLIVRIENAGSAPRYRNKRLTFQITLEPQGTWHSCINLIPKIEGEVMPPAYSCHSFFAEGTRFDRLRDRFLADTTQFAGLERNTLAPVVVGALEQATRDIVALRLHDLDERENAWTMAAGLPVYLGLFGRDTLTAALQAAIASPEMMQGTLPALARYQGTESNDWRDEQPGRMLHEAQTGPLEILNFNPRQRYYGSLTTSGLYASVVAELWHWTGDKDAVRPYISPAMKALHWVDTLGDQDGDGFSEYRTRSRDGLKNQGWKDSGDAMVYEDGSQVDVPISPSEEQGFLYFSKLQLSEVFWWLDEKEDAKRLYHEAEELKKRFNDKFWMEDEGFFAMALDPDKRQVKSIASNAGHVLASGIADDALVQHAADRLLAPDLFTGWGIRTLSSLHPAYNPYSYHRGSVWPVEHGTFAMGLMRLGLHQHVERIARAQFEAASLFEFYRLPELLSGHQRDEDHPFPAMYPQSNWPQTWSSSSLFWLVQALLGLYPYAPLNMLLVDPHLPEWLPEITLRNLHVGKATITLHFFRRPDGGSDYEILEKNGPLHVIRQPSPWSLTSNFGERLRDVLTSFIPGR
ncbi:MAG: glycogen debranching N-terminal domain-containing protein [Acidobacteriaceae bacterium]